MCSFTSQSTGVCNFLVTRCTACMYGFHSAFSSCVHSDRRHSRRRGLGECQAVLWALALEVYCWGEMAIIGLVKDTTQLMSCPLRGVPRVVWVWWCCHKVWSCCLINGTLNKQSPAWVMIDMMHLGWSLGVGGNRSSYLVRFGIISHIPKINTSMALLLLGYSSSLLYWQRGHNRAEKTQCNTVYCMHPLELIFHEGQCFCVTNTHCSAHPYRRSSQNWLSQENMPIQNPARCCVCHYDGHGDIFAQVCVP